MFKPIKNAVSRSTRRELDHLLDAQRAIGNALKKSINQYRNILGYEVVDELVGEAVEKKQAICKLCAPDVIPTIRKEHNQQILMFNTGYSAV